MSDRPLFGSRSIHSNDRNEGAKQTAVTARANGSLPHFALQEMVSHGVV